MHVVSDLLKRRIVPLQRRPRLCCWFTGPNDIGRIQHGPGTDLSGDELAVLVGGITGETFVPESLILPQNIPALCDDPGLRTAILATLPTLDESGMAVRQTGGRDPHRGIRISDAPAGGPQPAGVAPSAPAVAPIPLDKGKGAASSASAPGGPGGSEEERRRRLRRADGSLVLEPPQKRQRTAGGAEEASSQTHGAQRASSRSAPKAKPPPPNTMPTDGSGSQQQASAGSGVGDPPPDAAKTAPTASHAPAGDPAAAAPASGGVAARRRSQLGDPPPPDTGGDAGGTSSSNHLPAPEEMEVVFGRRLRSSAEQEAAPVPLPRMLSRAHQVLSDTGAAILREREALEAEHQRLSNWRTQLEESTKTASCQFISERSQLEQDRKEYKGDLQKVCARELEASRREKVARREEALTQRKALTIEYQTKLNALDQTLEAQRVQQVKAVERMRKWGKSSRRERKLEERIRQFNTAQVAPGPQAVEATRKALEDLQAEHHARVQRIATWAGEASTTMVPLGMSPIPVSELLTSISDVLPVLNSTADRLRRLNQIPGARLEAEGGNLCRARH
eukprot:XP_020393566.1 mediator of RNA polymerase II transcription subunit 12-like [Zea mays]